MWNNKPVAQNLYFSFPFITTGLTHELLQLDVWNFEDEP
jgi:hypothetical protein